MSESLRRLNKIDAMDYGKIIRTAWAVQRQHRHYLILGALMGLGFANLRNFGYSDTSSNLTADDLQTLLGFIYGNWPAMLALAIGCIASALIFSLVRHIARSGMIRSVLARDTEMQRSLAESWKFGLKYFGRTWLISFLTFVFLSLVLFALSVPIIFSFTRGSTAAGSWLAILALVIFSAIAIGSSYTARYATLYTVSSDLNLSASIEHGYLLFRKNIAASLIMSLVLTGMAIAYFLATTVIFTLSGIALKPFLPTNISPNDISVGWLAAWTIWSVAVGAFQALLFSPLLSLIEISWTLLFRELAGGHATEQGIEPAATGLPIDKEELLSPIKTDEIGRGVDNSSRN